MTFKFGKEIDKYLKAQTEITNLVSNRIFPVVVTVERVKTPFIVYNRETIEATESKDKTLQQQTETYTFQVITDGYQIGLDICEALNDKLSHLHGNLEEFVLEDTEYVSYSEGYSDTESSKFVFSLQYQFKITIK